MHGMHSYTVFTVIVQALFWFTLVPEGHWCSVAHTAQLFWFCVVEYVVPAVHVLHCRLEDGVPGLFGSTWVPLAQVFHALETDCVTDFPPVQ